MSLTDNELAEASFGCLAFSPSLIVRKLQRQYGGQFALQLKATDLPEDEQVYSFREDFCSKEVGSVPVSLTVSWPNGTYLDDKPVKQGNFIFLLFLHKNLIFIILGGRTLNGLNACSSWQVFDHPLDANRGRVVKFRLSPLGGFGSALEDGGGYNIAVQRHITSSSARNPGPTSGIRNLAQIPHEMFEGIRAFWFLQSPDFKNR